PHRPLVLAPGNAPTPRAGNLMAAPGATLDDVGTAQPHADYARAARRNGVFGTGKGIGAYLVLTLFAVIAVVPFLYLLSPSLRQSYALLSFPPQWFPKTLYWGNFDTVLHKTSYLRWALNTF